ncbi:MAG: phosphotransferase, partial [Planctomycetota bacterium]|nr:phosphotransferase [Planctomycetota bacterium]
GVMICAMGNTWDAEVEVTGALVRELLAWQFSGLTVDSIESYGEGWDNVAFLINGGLVFRFPKREAARQAMEQETLGLSGLRGSLPAPIPHIHFVGQPQGGYPFPFNGYPELPGRTACSVDWNEAQRVAIAPELGAFLSRLHSEDQELARGGALPGDQIRRTDLPYRLVGLEERLAQLEPSSHLPDLKALAQRARDLAITEPWSGRPRVVHGDLYARHLLVDSDQRLAVIIDWGDMHLGDPALDLSILFGFLPVSARKRFEQAYGSIDANTRRRARFRAMVLGATLVQYGESVGDNDIAGAGRAALGFSME